MSVGSLGFVEFSLSDVPATLKDWDPGWYFATIMPDNGFKDNPRITEFGVSRAKGNPMFTINFQLHSDTYGSAYITDYITVEWGKRDLAELYFAAYNMSEDDRKSMREAGEDIRFEIADMIGKELLVNINLGPARPGRDGVPVQYMELVGRKYAPQHEADVLLGNG